MPSQRSKGLSGLDPVFVLIAAVVGFIVGYGSLRLGAYHDPMSSEFASSPGFGLWSFLMGIQTAAWAVMARPLWTRLGRYRSEWRRHRAGMLASCVAILAIVGVGPFLNRYIDWPLWLHEVRISTITAIGVLLIGIPALGGVLLARYRVQDMPDDSASPRSVKTIVDSRGDLRRFLFIAGVAVVLATIGTAALQSAVAPRFVAESAFSRTTVLGYGALLTGLLLILYVPAHLAVLAIGRRVIDSAFDLGSMPDPMTEEFTKWFEERRNLERLLELDARHVQDLQDALVILGPLLSGILSVRFENL